jgi:hypothetical protein
MARPLQHPQLVHGRICQFTTLSYCVLLNIRFLPIVLEAMCDSPALVSVIGGPSGCGGDTED